MKKLQINKTQMANPYFWDFPKRQDTMFMATIQNSDNSYKRYVRDSTFQRKDIDGAYCRQQIPVNVNRQTFINSTYIEPRPQFARSVKKVSDPLNHNDIEGSFPQAVAFKTNRIVNPIIPKYKLASSDPVDAEPPAKFLRNTLDIGDIVRKKQARKQIKSPKEQKIEGSCPKKLFRTLQAVSRLSVQDINRDGQFFSARRENPTDPLNPSYVWRDGTDKGSGLSFTKPTLQQQYKPVNSIYGQIYGTKPKQVIPMQSTKNPILSVHDIEGAHSNSYNQSRYFQDKRRQFRNYMKIDDIQKAHASSLKKGISTRRSLNPLIPKYDYPN